MFDAVYMLISTVITISIILLIARYIFQEPKFGKTAAIITSFMICVTWGAYLIWGEGFGVVFIFVSAGLSLFMARKKHRIRGFFLVIPVMGIAFGIMVPLDYLLQCILSSDKMIDSAFVIDMLTLILLLVFWWRGKAWRIQFEQEVQFRKLGRWERNLLIGTGWLIILLGSVVWGLEEATVTTLSVTYIIVVINITMFILTVTIIAYIWRGNRSAYYEGIAKINEHYLEMELQHFEAYRLTQREVRRMQHDMKHHVACLQHLCKQGAIEEIQNYLDDMSDVIETGDMEINCGHVLVNSICTHKAHVAAQKGIRLEVSGRIPEPIALLPIDLCTILSNALDNAIEAVADLEESRRVIQLEMSCQGKMLLFRFRNPIRQENSTVKLGVTKKEDALNHGFGLLNIKYAVEKYNGQMLLEIEEKDIPEFVLSVIIGTEIGKD